MRVNIEPPIIESSHVSPSELLPMHTKTTLICKSPFKRSGKQQPALQVKNNEFDERQQRVQNITRRNWYTSSYTLDEFQREPRAMGKGFQDVATAKLKLFIASVPVSRFDWNLLVQKLAPLSKDEVAPLRLATFSSSQCSNQNPFRIRNQGIRKLLLHNYSFHMSKISPESEQRHPHLGLPFSLSGGGICTQAVHVEIHRGEIGIGIAEPTRLSRAASCAVGTMLARRFMISPRNNFFFFCVLTSVSLGNQEKNDAFL